MTKLIYLVVLVVCFMPAKAQETDTLPVYKRFPTIPVFKLYTAPDSTTFTQADLKKHKPVMFILFSPDCEHCKKAFADLVSNIDLFKKVTIVMCSAIRYDLIRDFYNEHHVADYPDIIMGRDPASFLNTFFANRYFPGIFIYDKKGKLAGEVRKHPDFKKIAEML